MEINTEIKGTIYKKCVDQGAQEQNLFLCDRFILYPKATAEVIMDDLRDGEWSGSDDINDIYNSEQSYKRYVNDNVVLLDILQEMFPSDANAAGWKEAEKMLKNAIQKE